MKFNVINTKLLLPIKINDVYNSKTKKTAFVSNLIKIKISYINLTFALFQGFKDSLT